VVSPSKRMASRSMKISVGQARKGGNKGRRASPPGARDFETICGIRTTEVPGMPPFGFRVPEQNASVHADLEWPRVCRTLSQLRNRVASRRTLSPRRRSEHESPVRARRCLLQQATNAVRLQLQALACNLDNFLRTVATPEPIQDWSPRPICRLPDGRGRHPTASGPDLLRLIAELRPQPPAPA
jgi:hypothetical protein